MSVRQCPAFPVLLGLLAVVSRSGLRETNAGFNNAFLLGFLQPEGAFDFVKPEILIVIASVMSINVCWVGRRRVGLALPGGGMCTVGTDVCDRCREVGVWHSVCGRGG
ncbi:hypothetical protein CcI6DRAFT_01627 [Frankia sp. CcI6]|nr:hypothetical protein CcI6DRAFT_01627 [Frankia sp. CcI6]KFB06166.1 hypothetical protein ALLO2DRAFT_01080 [Frankia sp. Allo2]OAA25314.1 hypothetical protein AAY23_104057 [Frankia casuarinae]OHV55222.1 hypothetical protein CgIS1_10685 [Frankia sp. CgIS1]